MADDDATPTQRGEHPVLSGLVALVGVALVVGLILGGGALAATKVLGLDDDGAATDQTTSEDSLYLPRPSDTLEPSGPLVTLDSAPGQGGGTKQPKEPKATEPETQISLSAGQTAVGPMEQLDLSGVYPGGEGAILQVQRRRPGTKWEDFAVVASVSNETFATYIQTGQTGPNFFRMKDTDTGETSNEVRVVIG